MLDDKEWIEMIPFYSNCGLVFYRKMQVFT